MARLFVWSHTFGGTPFLGVFQRETKKGRPEDFFLGGGPIPKKSIGGLDWFGDLLLAESK